MLASGMMPPRPVLLSLAIMVVTVIVGLTVRFAPLGLPSCIVKYGGSTMWALMAYWIVSTLLPSQRLLTVVFLTGTLATAVEFVKLYHLPLLDAFRLTFPGIVLFGRYFSVWDIVAYWLAICVGALMDRGIRPAEQAVHSEK
jgi:Protein of unknown function (DUF2809)